ncbi:COP23 domain-containing protein [Crocosphaera sp. Alani8]|uniref:COP23 domain-containing protein n=1 Tax=Crocosphaera sp. Alani8 TaxID=3038952 RepID=UPI00313CE35B
MMKLSLLAAIFTASATVTLNNFGLNSSLQARNVGTNFTCRNWQGVPTTLAETSDLSTVPVLMWESDYFSNSGYDPSTRCQLVSGRFQYFYNNGQLKYITTGRMNRMPVVCVTQNKGGGCEGLLFTLKQGVDPTTTLQKLMAVRVRASGPLNQTNNRTYINFEEYLSQAKK